MCSRCCCTGPRWRRGLALVALLGAGVALLCVLSTERLSKNDRFWHSGFLADAVAALRAEVSWTAGNSSGANATNSSKSQPAKSAAGSSDSNSKDKYEDASGRVLFCACGCKSRSFTFYNSSNVKLVGKHKLALMDHNSAYRIGDVVREVKALPKLVHWRQDMHAIMCNPGFRGTLLRSILQQNVLIDGEKVDHLSDEALEDAVSRRGDGRVGYFYGAGLEGPDNITLPNSSVCRNQLRKALQERYDKLGPENNRALLIPLRLGDDGTKWPQVQRAMDLFMKVPGRNVSQAIVSGVLHYPATSHFKEYYYTEKSQRQNEDLVDRVLNHLRSKYHLATSVRSEPNVDVDLLSMARSHYVLPIEGRGGMQAVALEIRQKIRGIRFLSHVGCEHAGHQKLIPALRKILMSVGMLPASAPMKHNPALTFWNGQRLFDMFNGRQMFPFWIEMLTYDPNQVVMQEYIFSNKDMSTRPYQLQKLDEWLRNYIVVRRVIFKFEPEAPGKECHGEKHIEKELTAIAKSGILLLRLNSMHLERNCSAFVENVLAFLRQKNILLPEEERKSWEMDEVVNRSC